MTKMEHEYMKRFEEMGAVLRGDHFVLASGDHSANYFNAKALFNFAKTNQEFMTEIGESILERFEGMEIDLVVGPAMGGNILAKWVTTVLGLRPENIANDNVPLITKKAESGEETNFMPEGLGWHSVSGSNVLVVEDVVTTGGSVQKVVRLVREYGGKVVGVGSVCTHGKTTARKMSIPRFQSLVHMQMATHKEGYCPICYKKEIPVNVQHGHGQKFLDRLAAS